MSYTINHQRISKLTRDRLLRLLEQVDREKCDALSRLAEFDLMREDRDMLLAQRDQAVSELDIMSRSRDYFQAKAAEYFAKFTNSETETSRRDGTIADRDRRIVSMQKSLTRTSYFCLVGWTLFVFTMTVLATVKVLAWH